MGFNKKAVEKFRLHGKSDSHLNSILCWNSYKKCKSVGELLDKNHETRAVLREEKLKRSRQLLQHFVDVVILLAKSGRPFRGHTESEESTEKGLFLDIINHLK